MVKSSKAAQGINNPLPHLSSSLSIPSPKSTKASRSFVCPSRDSLYTHKQMCVCVCLVSYPLFASLSNFNNISFLNKKIVLIEV